MLFLSRVLITGVQTHSCMLAGTRCVRLVLLSFDAYPEKLTLGQTLPGAILPAQCILSASAAAVQSSIGCVGRGKRWARESGVAKEGSGAWDQTLRVGPKLLSLCLCTDTMHACFTLCGKTSVHNSQTGCGLSSCNRSMQTVGAY